MSITDPLDLTAVIGERLELKYMREFAGTQPARLRAAASIVAALPPNATGKILKTQLRKQFGQSPAVPAEPF